MWKSLDHFLQATAIRLTGTDRNPFDMSRHPVDILSTGVNELKTKILNGSGRQWIVTIRHGSANDLWNIKNPP